MLDSCATLRITNRQGNDMCVAIANVPIEQAATSTGIKATLLAHLVNSGAIPGLVGGQTGWCDLEAVIRLAERLEAIRTPVEGVPILATEAAKRYGFDSNTIYRWGREGWVKILVDKSRGRLYNEGDIAVAKTLANLTGHAQGKSVFPAKPRSGRPRKPSDN